MVRTQTSNVAPSWDLKKVTSFTPMMSTLLSALSNTTNAAGTQSKSPGPDVTYQTHVGSDSLLLSQKAATYNGVDVDMLLKPSYASVGDETNFFSAKNALRPTYLGEA